MIESLDGRVHLEQLRRCCGPRNRYVHRQTAGGESADVLRIYDEAKAAGVPIFSSSSLRFGKSTLAARAGALGNIKHCEASSPASLEPHHVDLYWYGIMAVNHCTRSWERVASRCNAGRLLMVKSKSPASGPRGESVFSVKKRLLRQSTGEKGEGPIGAYEGYDPLVFEIVKFFQTGTPPMTAEETIEIYTFMEAADESKRQGGAKVMMADVLKKARTEVDAKK